MKRLKLQVWDSFGRESEGVKYRESRYMVDLGSQIWKEWFLIGYLRDYLLIGSRTKSSSNCGGKALP